MFFGLTFPNHRGPPFHKEGKIAYIYRHKNSTNILKFKISATFFAFRTGYLHAKGMTNTLKKWFLNITNTIIPPKREDDNNNAFEMGDEVYTAS